MPPISRRRFLAISAAVAALPGSALADAPVARWRGAALGAGASMTLAGLDRAEAAPLISAAVAEIERLERIFSLYRADSALSRFNEAGRLPDPPPELLELLSLCGAIHRRSGGAFDPTVQPLWRLHARCAAEGRLPTQAEIDDHRALTGWAALGIDSAALRANFPGLALTLNGIAQGYIADRVANSLRAAGMTGVAVDMGEIKALGTRADGRPWRAGIVAPDGEIGFAPVPLTDRALATSAPRGTVLDRAGRVGHIIDPRTGRPGGLWRLVSVSAPSAALADGLSTAFTLLPRDAIDRVLSAYPDAQLEAVQEFSPSADARS